MSFWNWLIHRKRREADLEEEIQSHLRMAAQERMEQGEAAEGARTFGRPRVRQRYFS